MVPPEQVRAVTSRDIAGTGHDTVALFIEWLNELIYLFDTAHLLFRHFEIDIITETCVAGRAFGEPYDATRHELSMPSKP